MTPSEIGVGKCTQCDTAIFDADEHEDEPEPVAEVVEPVLPPRQQEVRGAQPEDGERVRGEHQVRLVAHGEHGRHRVDREDHVGELDDDERGEQRRRGALHVHLGEEVVTVELGRHRHEPSEEPDRAVVAVHAFVGAVPQHLDPRVHEEHTEHEQQPPEPGDERDAGRDEDRAQHERAEHAPEQHAVLVPQRDRERREDHRPHEHVVDRQRLLDQVPREVLTGRGAAPRRPHHDAEAQAARDPHERLDERAPRRRLLVAAVEHQVDAQHHDDRQQQPRPRDRGTSMSTKEPPSPDLATASGTEQHVSTFRISECDSKVSPSRGTAITAGDTGMDRALGSNSPVLTMPPERGTPLQ